MDYLFLNIYFLITWVLIIIVGWLTVKTFRHPVEKPSVSKNEKAKKDCDFFADDLQFINQYCDCKVDECKKLDERAKKRQSD